MQWLQYSMMIAGAAAVVGSGLAFQQATLYWARRIVSIMASAPSPASVEGFSAARRIQDAITPPWHTAYMISSELLALAVLVVGWYYLGWLAGLVGLTGGFVASGIVRGLWPPPHAEIYRRRLLRNLRSRATRFAVRGDGLREAASRYFVSALEEAGNE